ncbi:MAG: thrombospondin type 3 repeat-containing protein [Saprospiraceae bacterium]
MSKTVLNFLCTCLLVAYFSTIAIAQSPTQPNGIAVKGLFINHIENTFSDFKNNTYGAELTYLRHLKGPLKLAVPFKVGSVDIINDLDGRETSRLLVSMDALLHLSLFKDHRILAPYIFSGIGLSYLDVALTDGETFPVIPAGVGLQIKLKSELYAQLQYEYRFPLDNAYGNNQLGVGIAYYFSGKPKIKDMDGDGIADEMDDCPELPGTEDLFGCPDTDGDGLADQFDKCPEVIGLAKLGGCPDTDEDGVPDNTDDCPQEAGPKENGGCPHLDSD